MQIAEIRTDKVIIASCDGRLDTSTAAEAEKKLLSLLKEGALVADFAGVRYVSSAGLRVLLKTAKQAKGVGVGFAVCALQPGVREVFEISGFDKVIKVYATRAEATAAA
ncbi:MAG: STAS domain-containing protein [Geminicoccaceae bacterium]